MSGSYLGHTKWDWQTLSILNGTALSTKALCMGEFMYGCVKVPSGWTAANLAFEVSGDGQTFSPLVDAAGATVVVAVTGAGGKWFPLPDQLKGVAHFKVRSCNSATPANDVNQGGDRSVELMLKG